MFLSNYQFIDFDCSLKKCQEKLQLLATFNHALLGPLLYCNETDYEHQPCFLDLFIDGFISESSRLTCEPVVVQRRVVRQIPALWAQIHPQAARLAAGCGAQQAFLKPQCTL